MIPAHAGMMALGGGSGLGFDAQILSLSPWAYWKLDDASLNALDPIVDSSGNGRNAAVSGVASGLSSVSGIFASSPSAIDFPAVGGDGIVCPSYSIAVNEVFSIVGFITVPSVDSVSRQILSSDDGGSNRLWQFRLTSGKIEFITIYPSVTVTQSASTLSAGSSHMVVVVFDPTLSAGSGVVKIYIDGVLDVQSSTAITITAASAGPAIGMRSGFAFANYYGGVLDNMAIFRARGLTSSEISDLWNARDT